MKSFDVGEYDFGYNPKGKDRGEHGRLSEATAVRVDNFISNCLRLLEKKGEIGGVVSHYPEAHSRQAEEARDEIMHRLGLIFDFDVDEALTWSEQRQEVTLDPADKATFGFDDPETPTEVNALVRSITFCPVELHDALMIYEIEFTDTQITPQGERDRPMRIIGCATTS